MMTVRTEDRVMRIMFRQKNAPRRGIDEEAGGVDAARILRSRKKATKMFIPSSIFAVDSGGSQKDDRVSRDKRIQGSMST